MQVNIAEKAKDVTIDSLQPGDVFVFGFESLQPREIILRRAFIKAAWTNFTHPNFTWGPPKSIMCVDLKDGSIMELPSTTRVLKAQQAEVKIVI